MTAAAPTLPPFITYDAHRAAWISEREYESRPASLSDATIVIPAGFACDLSSVPRVLWNLIAPFELSIGGPLTHDWLYRHRGAATVRFDDSSGAAASWTFSRAQADRFFLDLMKVEGVVWWKRTLAYHAVRWFGRSSWGH